MIIGITYGAFTARKPRNTWEKCWKLHGKPTTSNKEWGYNGGQQRDNA